MPRACAPACAPWCNWLAGLTLPHWPSEPLPRLPPPPPLSSLPGHAQDWLNKQLDEQLQALFSVSFATLFETFDGVVPPFVTFMRGVSGGAARGSAGGCTQGCGVQGRCAQCWGAPLAGLHVKAGAHTSAHACIHTHTCPLPPPSSLHPFTHARTPRRPRQDVDVPPYEPVRDMSALKDTVTDRLEEYALEPGASAMDLVLFRDALHHICRCGAA